MKSYKKFRQALSAVILIVMVGLYTTIESSIFMPNFRTKKEGIRK